MTLEESKNLNLGKGISYSAMPCASMSGFVPPTDPLVGDQVKTPEASKTYNGMSINDIHELNKFRLSDDLHRPDLLRGDYLRAKRLQEFGSAVGVNEFINSYTKFKK